MSDFNFKVMGAAADGTLLLSSDEVKSKLDFHIGEADARINELEKQLSEVKRNYNNLYNDSFENEKAYKVKLSESVPKKDIQTILEWCYEGGLNKENVLTHATILTDKFEKLLTSHKE